MHPVPGPQSVEVNSPFLTSGGCSASVTRDAGVNLRYVDCWGTGAGRWRPRGAAPLALARKLQPVIALAGARRRGCCGTRWMTKEPCMRTANKLVALELAVLMAVMAQVAAAQKAA